MRHEESMNVRTLYYEERLNVREKLEVRIA